ncbi:hypothetical protein D3C80_1555160 [compost metagenome]
MIAEGTLGLCRRAHYQALLGAFEASLDEGRGADDAAWRDVCAVHDHRIHAHQGIGAYPAAVQNRAVAHMAMALYHRIAAREAVHHAGVLQVGTLL